MTAALHRGPAESPHGAPGRGPTWRQRGPAPRARRETRGTGIREGNDGGGGGGRGGAGVAHAGTERHTGTEAVSGHRRLWWSGAGRVCHCLPLPWSLQRLKAAVHYTVGCLCQEVQEDKDVQFSKQSIAAISEITFRQCGTAGLPAFVCVTWSGLVLPGLPQRSLSVQEPSLEAQGFKNNSAELGLTGAFSCIVFFKVQDILVRLSRPEKSV